MLGDLNKLKVVELKAELANRGMDTKGVKAVLVDRLKAVLEREGAGTSASSSVSANEDHRSSHDSNDDAEEIPSTPSRRGRRTASVKEVSSTEEETEATTSFEERVPPCVEESTASVEQEVASDAPEESSSDAPEESSSDASEKEALIDAPEQAESDLLEQAASDAPEQAASYATVQAASYAPEQATSYAPEQAASYAPEQTASYALDQAASVEPQQSIAIGAEENRFLSATHREILERVDNELTPQNTAIEAQDAVKAAIDDESSESKSSSEQQDSISDHPVEDPELKEPQPSIEALEDQSIPSDEESKPSSSELIGDSESSNCDFQGELLVPAETDEDSLLKGDAELAEPKSLHESMKIKVEPPDFREVKTEPVLDQDGIEVKEEQADGSRRPRKSRFTDNDDPVQSGSEVKEEPMDTDGAADSASEHVKSESSNDRRRRRSSSRSPRRSRSPQIKKQDDEPEIDDTVVLLSWYDSDLNLIIEKENFLTATPMHQQGFGYIWAGVRASFGFLKGKICYEVKCEEECDVSHLQDEPNPHVLRVGWSVQGTSMQLGEEKGSYGYGGTGKSSVNCQFKDYGKAFGVGDTITACLDMDSEPKILSYSVNGESQGVAYEISSDALAGKALFPHILSKNIKFSVNFSAEPAFPLTEGFTLCGNVTLEDRVAGPRRPEKKEDCEILMMCGLPGAGKTFWANKHYEENPDKLINILGTNNLLDKMKVMGLPRKRNYAGRWDVLIDKCTRCLTKLLEVAGRRRRNYIIDQTNVYPSAVRRKMKAFDGFKRRAIVIVPADDEFQRRIAKREAEEGKDVPGTAVLEMKANFKLPEVGDLFSEVVHVELPEEEACALVEKYREEAKEKGFVPQSPMTKRFKSERSGGSGDRRHDDRHSSRENRDHRERGRDHRDNRGDNRGDNRDYRDRERTAYRPRGGPIDRNRSGWQPRGMQQGGGWRDRNDGYRGNRNDSRGQWRSGSGGGGGRGGMGGGGGYDRRGGGYNQNRGGYGGRGASKGWGYNQGSGGSSWGNWNQQSQDYSQPQWASQSQGQSTGYGTSWKSYGQQQQGQQQSQQGQQSQQHQHGYSQQSGYTTHGYNNYGNGSNSYNWNQQYYGSYGNWPQQGGATSATGASTGTGTSSTPAVASATSTYDPYQQWNQFTTYGYSTSSGSAAAGATGASHSGK